LTLLRGRTTSGKLTLAYKTLANLHAANPAAIVAILDLAHSAHPDYLTRCGVDLARLLLLCPESSGQAVDSLLDLT
jgi:RecA/RadA recombinase